MSIYNCGQQCREIQTNIEGKRADTKEYLLWEAKKGKPGCGAQDRSWRGGGRPRQGNLGDTGSIPLIWMLVTWVCSQRLGDPYTYVYIFLFCIIIFQ